MRRPSLLVCASLLVSCGEAPARPTIEPMTAPRATASTVTVAPATAPAATTSSASPTPPPSDTDDTPPLPEGFVAIPGIFDEPEGESKSVMCGNLRVENVRGDPKKFEPYVVATDAAGTKVYEAHGRRYDLGGVRARMQLTADVCGDVTGDGVPELLLTERTEGAHCCYTYHVASLGKPSKLIMSWEKGDSGDGFWPVKLKPGKAFQIRSVDRVWPPFKVDEGDPSIPYAGVPGFPIVFDLVNGKYEKRTFAFVDALRTERDTHDAACAKRRAAGEKEPAGCDDYELHVWGLALIVGDWATRKDQLVSDAELRAQLDKRAPAMLKKLRAQLGG